MNKTVLILLSSLLIGCAGKPVNIRRFVTLLKQANSIEIPISPKETRKKIAVIDTGIDFTHPELAPFKCQGGHADYRGLTIRDNHGHGSNIAWRIVRKLDPKKFCLMSLGFHSYDELGSENLNSSNKAFVWAIKQKAYLVNYSGGGTDYSQAEAKIVALVLKKGIIVVVAAGNEGEDTAKIPYYPACAVKHPNFFVVGGLLDNGSRMPSSNYGKCVTSWALGEKQEGPDGNTMSGTSQATANFSGQLLERIP